jgi:cupin domain
MPENLGREHYGIIARGKHLPSSSRTISSGSRIGRRRGRLTVKRGKETVEAGPGDVVVIEPGTPHKFWNAGDEEVRFTAEVRPSLEFEELIETMFLLAQDGKTGRSGMPNPLRLAVIAREYFDVVRLPKPPVWMQRAGLALGAPVGRLLGYAATYTPVAAEPIPVNARSRREAPPARGSEHGFGPAALS